MCKHVKNRGKNSVELADILKQYGDSYCKQHRLSSAQYKAINAICNCRTAILGGHKQKCNLCGAEEISYNSCGNGNCPKCQTLSKLRWLADRQAELLPVEYFHVVFTVPHELNFLAAYNQAAIYNILFKAAWSTINSLGKDKKRLDGKMGMLAVLHTWGQNMLQHIHLHCIIPGGALRNKKEWISCKPGFLFPVNVMSKFFKGAFISLLQKAWQNGELTIEGTIAELSESKKFNQLLDLLKKKSWNVYAKKPFNGAGGGLEYLSRYVRRIVITNDRILSCDNEKVKFKWRDYADHNKIKIMTLEAHEFIRRFLSHVLSQKVMRVRAFGFLANSCKTKNINIILGLLNQPNNKKLPKKKETSEEIMKRLAGIDIGLCKKCKKGRMQIIEIIPSFKQTQTYADTS